MDSSGYLNLSAVASVVGVVRLLEIALGCVTFSLVCHDGGGFGQDYGNFCVFVWCFCFATSAAIVSFEFTRLHGCLRLSWDNLTISFAMLASLMYLTASTVYPIYFVGWRCGGLAGGDCRSRNLRLSASVCSALACLAYMAEVHLTRAKPGHVAGYMATPPGLLKVVQGYVACVIFGAVVNESRYERYPATRWCVAVYGFCFALTAGVVLLNISGRKAAFRCPVDRFVVLFTFLAVLLYLSAAIAWPIFCFDAKYGSASRPSHCPSGLCPWDSQLVITIFTYVNLLLYVIDLVYSQKIRFIG